MLSDLSRDRIRRVRATSANADPLSLRRELERELGTATLQHALLPAAAIVCVRRVRVAASRGTPLGESLGDAIGRLVPAMVRPLQGPVPANAEAVVFFDEAELLGLPRTRLAARRRRCMVVAKPVRDAVGGRARPASLRRGATIRPGCDRPARLHAACRSVRACAACRRVRSTRCGGRRGLWGDRLGILPIDVGCARRRTCVCRRRAAREQRRWGAARGRIRRCSVGGCPRRVEPAGPHAGRARARAAPRAHPCAAAGLRRQPAGSPSSAGDT